MKVYWKDHLEEYRMNLTEYFWFFVNLGGKIQMLYC
jgi:hypothetical protein